MTNVAATAALPEWNLADLYTGPDSRELAQDLERTEESAKKFAQDYKGKLQDLSGDTLGKAVASYEELAESMGKIATYAQLFYCGNISDPERGRFYQDAQEKLTRISMHTLFFALELNRLDDAVLAEKMTADELAHYQSWVRDVRMFRPHQLSDELEEALHEKEVSGHSAWIRLFDETMAQLRFPIDGKKVTLTEALNLLSEPDASRRRTAAEAIGDVLGDNIALFSLVTNTLAKDKEIEDRWRHYPHPYSSRNLANQVEDEVVGALVDSVKESYPRLSHRYYAMKARWAGKEVLDYWDRNAPLPDDDNRLFSWDEAQRIVLDAYEAFSPELAAIGRRFFDGGWIDVPARPGKASGAFAHPAVPSVHPYLLLNFLGKSRDVMTLAHELGHGIHQILAAKQGYLMADTPLTLAETASVFGEMLTFRSMLDGEAEPRRRRSMLASKVEDMLNTVVRQIAFYEFERMVHSERRQGELSSERIGAIWMKVQTESLGPTLRFDERYAAWWSYVPHFIHSPFYVYAYAFGDCLVNSLYDAYCRGMPGFQDKYMSMLEAGGTLRHRDLLKPFGLDASEPAFWRGGLDVVSGLIDELEAVS